MNHIRYKIYLFLKAVQGNWRNALYIQCDTECPYEQKTPCRGYLLTADDHGTLFLMPVCYFQQIMGETVYPNECIGILTRSTFEQVFHLYIVWNTTSARDCALKQLCSDMEI